MQIHALWLISARKGLMALIPPHLHTNTITALHNQLTINKSALLSQHVEYRVHTVLEGGLD
jgi:hypothetical protein